MHINGISVKIKLDEDFFNELLLFTNFSDDVLTVYYARKHGFSAPITLNSLKKLPEFWS